MRFAPQRHAFFLFFVYLNSCKRSGAEVLCAFWLRNALRAKRRALLSISTSKGAPNMVWLAPCAFWFPHVLRAAMACTFLNPNPSCIERFDFAMCFPPQRRTIFDLSFDDLPRWLRTRRFSKPILRPSRATRHWKNTVFHDFSTFSHASAFFSSDFFSSLTLPTSAFPSVGGGSFKDRKP